MAFLSESEIASNKLQIVVGATTFHFGVLSSSMHMAWVRVVCGRLESRLSYAPAVYNNFPWPEKPTESRVVAISRAAQGVLDARTAFPNATLADLYDAVTMPPKLIAAHDALDTTVDAAYGKKGFSSDADRVSFLFELYQRQTSLLPAIAKPPKRIGRRKKTNKSVH
jgi:hypothetical protein